MPEPQINTGTSLDSVVSGLGGKSMDTATYQKGMGTIEKGLEENIKERNNIPVSKPPELEPEPKLKDYQTDPWQTFGSFGMTLATLGALATKRPMTSALNAGAAVLNARNQADYAAYKDAFEKWKVNTDNAWKMADWQHSQVKDLYDRLKDNHADLTTEMEVLAKATQDPTLDHAIKGMDLQNAILAREKAVTELDKTREDLNLIHDKTVDTVEEWKKQNGVIEDKDVPKNIFTEARIDAETSVAAAKKGIAGVGGISGEQYDKLKSDPAMQLALKAYEITGDARQALGGGTMGGKSLQPRIEALQRMEYEKNPDFNPGLVKMMAQGYQKELNTVQMQNAKITLASNILDSSLPSLINAAKRLGLEESTSVNDLYNAARRQFNSADFKNFQTQLRAATTDYANFIGRSRQTVHSDEEALKILNENMNTASLVGFKDAVTTERSNVRKGMEGTIEDIQNRMLGKPAKEADVGDGSSKESPLPLPPDNNYEKGSWYTNDRGEVGKYVGEKNGQHVFE